MTTRQRRVLKSLGLINVTSASVQGATKIINNELVERGLGGRQRHVRYRLGCDHQGYVYKRK